jgi:hypothetical protein
MTNHDGSSNLMTLGYLDFPAKLGPRIPQFEFVGPSFGYAFINPPYLPARSGKSQIHGTWIQASVSVKPIFLMACNRRVGGKRLLLFQATGKKDRPAADLCT